MKNEQNKLQEQTKAGLKQKLSSLAEKRKIEKPRRLALRFSPTAWAKLLYFRDKSDNEVGGFGIMGILWLQLIDHDVVEESNLASQGYLEDDLNKLKVEATAELCRLIDSGLEVNFVPERFRRSMEIGNIVFCCVDRIEFRRLVWESVRDKVSFFTDGRMSAEVLRVLTACDFESRKHYPTNLFNADEAFVGPCTAKTTIYCANIAAGLMIAQFTKYLRLLPIDADIQVNLLSSELSVG